MKPTEYESQLGMVRFCASLLATQSERGWSVARYVWGTRLESYRVVSARNADCVTSARSPSSVRIFSSRGMVCPLLAPPTTSAGNFRW